MTQFALSGTSISVLPAITEDKVAETSKKGNWGRGNWGRNRFSVYGNLIQDKGKPTSFGGACSYWAAPP